MRTASISRKTCCRSARTSSRLTLNIGADYTLNFPSTEVHNHGAGFDLHTQVLDFPHRAPTLECRDIGHRLGLAYRATRNLVTGWCAMAQLCRITIIRRLGRSFLQAGIDSELLTLKYGSSRRVLDFRNLTVTDSIR
jgi:hypothetical protein